MILPSKHQRLSLREKPLGRIPIIKQKWRDLFFIHWTCDPLLIQKTLPKGLYVDTFENQAYLGIVPFKMCDVRPLFLPAISGISNFLELNLRTYVHNEKGVPGVWFYALETNQRLAKLVAQQFFHLPYFMAEMQVEQIHSKIRYYSKREGYHQSTFFELEYTNNFQEAPLDSLEFFLTERYLLYSFKNGQLFNAQIFHHPYLISHAKMVSMDNPLFDMHRLKTHCSDPIHLSFSPGVDVRIYSTNKELI